MRHYDKISEITIQEQILNNLDNVDAFNELIDGIEDGTLPEYDGNLSLALMELTTSVGIKNVEKAKKIINKIDLSTFSDRDHYEMLWGIANNRGDGGREAPSFLVIEQCFKLALMLEPLLKTELTAKKQIFLIK